MPGRLVFSTTPDGSSTLTERMRITNAGNVGIGTTSPVSALTVVTGFSGSAGLTTGNGSISFGNGNPASTSPAIYGRSDESTGLRVMALTADSNNYVQGDMNFDVRQVGNSNYTTLTNTAFTFTRFGANLVSILRNGNVGIGTTTPNTALSVVGSSSVTGAYQINGISVLSEVGANNLRIGEGAGASLNPTAIYNLAVGTNALAAATSSSYNLAIGQGALANNSTGTDNTALGVSALLNNTVGYSNTALGHFAEQQNIDGAYNTAVGEGSLQNNNHGSFNTVLGYAAGNSVQNTLNTGANTLIGYNTGSGLIDGTKNTIIGANVSISSSTLSNNIILADGAGNQRLTIDQTGKVGIGTSSPIATLHIATGNSFMTSLNTQANNLFVEGLANSGITIGSAGNNSVYFGRPTANNAGQIVYTNGDQFQFFTNATQKMTLTSAGEVGIGDSTPTALLDVGGTYSTTNSSLILNAGTLASTLATQYGILNQPTFNPNVASVTNIYGMNNQPNISGSATSSITGLTAYYSQLKIASGFNNTVSNGYNFFVADPSVAAGVKDITNFYGFRMAAITNGNGATSTSVTNTGLSIVSISAAASTSLTNAATVTNYGMNMAIPSGNTASTSNYGIFLSGNGGTAAKNNYSFYNNSPADSYFAGLIGIGSSSASYALTVASTTPNGSYVGYFENTSSANNVDGIGIRIDDTTLTTGNAFVTFLDATGTTIGSITGSTSASNVFYNTTSDIRLKENFASSTYGLKDLLRVAVANYNFKSSPGNTTNGFLAQQLYGVYPFAVSKPDSDATGYWAVDYGKVTPLLAQSIQDEYKSIDELLRTGTTTMGATLFTSLNDGVTDTVWEKLVSLVKGFADGVLTLTGLKTDKVETKELCVGSTCITESELKDLINQKNSASVGNSGSTGGTTTTTGSGSGVGDTSTSSVTTTTDTTGSTTATTTPTTTTTPDTPSVPTSTSVVVPPPPSDTPAP
jgi:hypothetical protein